VTGALNNETKGLGYVTNNWVVRDPATKRIKATFRVTTVGDPVGNSTHGETEGLAEGQVFTTSPGGETRTERLIANVRDQRTFLHTTTQFGAATTTDDPTNPAIITSGSCPNSDQANQGDGN
jgi:hypothetical protein